MNTLFNLIFAILITELSREDIKNKKISTIVLFTGTITLLSVEFLSLQQSGALTAAACILKKIPSAAFAFLFYTACKKVSEARFSSTLGKGDIYFAVFLALWLNIPQQIIHCLLSAVPAAAYVFTKSLISSHVIQNCTTKPIPFIPFMSLAFLLLYFPVHF